MWRLDGGVRHGARSRQVWLNTGAEVASQILNQNGNGMISIVVLIVLLLCIVQFVLYCLLIDVVVCVVVICFIVIENH